MVALDINKTTQLKKKKIPKSTFLKKLEYPIKICNTQLNKKGMDKILNY